MTKILRWTAVILGLLVLILFIIWRIQVGNQDKVITSNKLLILQKEVGESNLKIALKIRIQADINYTEKWRYMGVTVPFVNRGFYTDPGGSIDIYAGYNRETHPYVASDATLTINTKSDTVYALYEGSYIAPIPLTKDVNTYVIPNRSWFMGSISPDSAFAMIEERLFQFANNEIANNLDIPGYCARYLSADIVDFLSLQYPRRPIAVTTRFTNLDRGFGTDGSYEPPVVPSIEIFEFKDTKYVDVSEDDIYDLINGSQGEQWQNLINN